MALLPTADPHPGRTRWRRARRLILGVLLRAAIPVAFFCALEGCLRRAGYGRSTQFFIPDSVPGFYRTNPDFTAPFIPASFGVQPLSFRIRRDKGPNTVRVFVLGESAAQGFPAPGFGIAPQLRAQLKARYPGTSFEVFNLAIPAINSHVVYRIVRQAVEFGPDLLVIYMGNNEVVGPYGPGCAYLSSNPPLWFIRAGVWVRGTRTGQLLTALLGKAAIPKLRPRDWSGMDTFSGNPVRGDDPRLGAVYRNFSGNLRGILEAAGTAGVKTVLATVVANVGDGAPFISRHHSGLSPADSKAWGDASEAGSVALDLGDARSAVVGFGEALRIDPEFAETHFQLGRVAEAIGATGIARKRYLDALHWDAMHFRPDWPVNAIIRQAAREAGESVLLVDAARELGSDPDSAAPLAGHGILLDHVHFNWEGNFRLAQLLAGGCARQLFGPGAPAAGGLDSAGCAAALGFTADARLKVLQAVVQETVRPPFADQSTFTEDQARLEKDIDAAIAALGTPGARSAEIRAVRRVQRLDPDNADLAMLLADMESDSGDMSEAMSMLERASSLQPPSVELSRRKARALVGLRRFDEAEEILLLARETDGDHRATDQALVDVWAASRQLDRGRQFFERVLSRSPADEYLRLEYADLLFRCGDPAGAEREARRVWDDDPDGRSSAAALELLVRLYLSQQRPDAAEAMTLDAREHQPGDYANNRRLVSIYTARDDPSKVVESLRAVEASGPFSSSEHLDLARRLADLDRGLEMLGELARARDVARIEGRREQTETINRLIGIYRRRLSHSPAP
ncbi:MAG: tetratricopeptide repeat protein [Opitutaceae bacterium]|jgi:tetratricopeptide (TPR) repeat protein